MEKAPIAKVSLMRRFMYDTAYPIVDGIQESSGLIASLTASAAGGLALARQAHNALSPETLRGIPADAFYAFATPMGMMASALAMTAIATPIVMATTKKEDWRYKLNGILLPGGIVGAALTTAALAYAPLRMHSTFKNATKPSMIRVMEQQTLQAQKPVITHAGKQYRIVHPAFNA